MSFQLYTVDGKMGHSTYLLSLRTRSAPKRKPRAKFSPPTPRECDRSAGDRPTMRIGTLSRKGQVRPRDIPVGEERAADPSRSVDLEPTVYTVDAVEAGSKHPASIRAPRGPNLTRPDGTDAAASLGSITHHGRWTPLPSPKHDPHSKRPGRHPADDPSSSVTTE